MGGERELLELLNDGRFHSGQVLAGELGLSRGAVWKIIRVLSDQGLDIDAVRGRGYRLAQSLEFLDSSRIAAGLAREARDRIGAIEVHQAIDSTNTHLMRRARDGISGGTACLAEIQTAGRGRRGRRWVSPYAANLYLSLLWRFSNGFSTLMGLSLAVGVAVARALRGIGVVEVGLKWPNDLLWREHKLGGILLEFGGESAGPCFAVAGIGLNVAMPKDAGRAIDQPWIDLQRILGAGRVSRNALAASILNELATVLVRFEKHGFQALAEEWRGFDLTAGKRVRLKLPTGTIIGAACGVDDGGALLLQTDAGMQRFAAGEISLRIAE